MSAAPGWTVLTVVLLGAWHGVNPGMGWLSAVALGMQEQERRAVWRALLPLAAGHALAIALALAIGLVVGAFVPASALRWAVALLLVLFGTSRLVRGRHPRYGGMRMNMRTLTMWSFMMASAHGAGLMVLPFVLPRMPVVSQAAMRGAAPSSFTDAGGNTAVMSHGGSHPGHVTLAAHAGNRNTGLIVLIAHTLGFLLATGLIAVVVYEKLGLRLLRTLWVNLDLVWGIVLIATGVLTPVIS